MTAPLVVLVGPPGTGKTTVGMLVAERLGVAFRDSDADIVAMARKPIPQIFSEDGEPHFRLLERGAVRVAVAAHRGVLALGGGAVTDEDTRALLRGLPVVFLDVDLNEAIRRLDLDTPRPLLALDLRQRWRKLMEQRRPLYCEVSRVVVSTSGRTPDLVADAVIAALELARA
ncbi:shikimate kinase [Nocardia transvalensis]|uniref:shikimate kinase n=1 Tax=Nocardia transvalensis TaxID=37333 RepID=UPI001895F51B|nr:shikimate kinase [Nocardia transvalensis]MBF6331844.1 shikimate kinase [Nocardia transvalensis]